MILPVKSNPLRTFYFYLNIDYKQPFTEEKLEQILEEKLRKLVNLPTTFIFLLIFAILF